MVQRLLASTLLFSLLTLAACSALQFPAPAPNLESPPAATEDHGTGQPTVPPEGIETSAVVTILPPVVLETPTLVAPAATTSPQPTIKATIAISPTQGGLTSSAAQVTVKGTGFPGGKPVQIQVAPETGAAGQTGQVYNVGQVAADLTGEFATTFFMPSDIPEIAAASKIKVVALSPDSAYRAEAEFLNTDAPH